MWNTYDSPEDAFQFMNDLEVIAFKAMNANKTSKFPKMSFFVQNLTTKLSFCNFAVEMPWRSSFEVPA